MITEVAEDFAKQKAINMIRKYIASNYEDDNLSDDQLLSDYVDIYNVAMDMFNYGLIYNKENENL